MTIVDLAFPLRGSQIPLDHGYALYGALSATVPALHGAAWLGIHPIAGNPIGDDCLSLRQGAHLFLRGPAEQIPAMLPLAGRSIDVSGSRLFLGAPRVQALKPSAGLDARLVAVKLTSAPGKADGSLDTAAFEERYLAELGRQLTRLEVEGRLTLQGRQRIRVAGRRLVGFSVRVTGLAEEGSIRLQEMGLGGKRRMGCGLFRATRGPHDALG